MKQRDLTKGSITGNLMLFALPLMAGNLLQQCYNIADTLIVGRYLGANALAAVGSSYTLMTFLTSILIGMCMGSGAVFSIRFGQKIKKIKRRNFTFFWFDCCNDCSDQCFGIHLPATDFESPSGSGRSGSVYADIHADHICRNQCHIFI